MEETTSLLNLRTPPGSWQYTETFKDFGTDLETRRWWIALCFLIYSSWTTIATLSHVTTSGPSMEYLNMSPFELTVLANSPAVMALLFSYLGSWYLNKAFKDTFLLCLILSTLGAWIRYIAGSSYAWTLIGQLVLGIGAAPSAGFVTLIPDRWFAARERFAITTLCVYGTALALIFVYVLPPFIVNDDPNRIPLYTLIQAIMLSIAFVMGIFCIKERPKIPPSYSALVKLSDPRTFWKDMNYMFHLPTIRLTSLFFGIAVAMSQSVPMVSGIIAKNYDASSGETSLLGAGFALSGMITGILGTIWISISKMKKPDKNIKILIAPTLLALILLQFVTFPTISGAFICYCFVGVGILGSIPFIYHTFSEMTFPVPESVSSTTITFISALFSIFISFLSNINYVGSHIYIFLAILTLLCGVYYMFFMQIEYRREKADATHRKIDQESINSITMLEEKERGLRARLSKFAPL